MEDLENNYWVKEAIDWLKRYSGILDILDELENPKVEAGYSISDSFTTPWDNTETNAIVPEAVFTDIEKYLREHSSLQE